jgi:hypothetical protein
MTSYLLGIPIILALVALAIHFARRQLQVLRGLRGDEQIAAADRSYTRRQCYRRFLGCVLMLVLAGLVAGLLVVDIHGELERLADKARQAKAAGNDRPQLTEDEQAFLRFGLTYLGIIALTILLLLVVAFLDLLAIRRYGLRHRKRIRDDRRAMLRRQLPLVRRERREDS